MGIESCSFLPMYVQFCRDYILGFRDTDTIGQVVQTNSLGRSCLLGVGRFVAWSRHRQPKVVRIRDRTQVQ